MNIALWVLQVAGDLLRRSCLPAATAARELAEWHARSSFTSVVARPERRLQRRFGRARRRYRLGPVRAQPLLASIYKGVLRWAHGSSTRTTPRSSSRPSTLG